MGCFVVIVIIFISTVFFFSNFCFSQLIRPNFTASNLKFVDHTGAFLLSRNGTFKAAIYNPDAGQVNYYLCVIHVASNTIIWSANRDYPISNSGTMNLTVNGIVIYDDDGSVKWSTPRLQASVSALLLAETGNLVLLDRFNGSLWESFQYPTDTIVVGQKLKVGSSLSSAVSNTDLSTGDYSFVVVASDAVLQWFGKTYWKLSMDTKAYIDSNYMGEYMALNKTGLFLFAHNGSAVVLRVIVSQSDFEVAKLDNAGQFVINSFSGTTWKEEFKGPDDACRIPFICHRIGLCTSGAASSSPVCSCPSGFHADSKNTSNCVPSNPSLSLPSSCTNNTDSQSNYSEVLYFSLGNGSEYFSIAFSEPIKYGVNMSICRNICSNNCSCVGYFYENSSGSCYLLEDELGSIISKTSDENDLLGYIKVLARTYPTTEQSYNPKQFPTVAIVFLPIAGLSLLIAIGFLFWRRKSMVRKSKTVQLGGIDFNSSEEFEAFSIPGLPRRFHYEELVTATDSFKTQIGSGGFGTVYKGMLPDDSLVAVKKITNLGSQGKKEFCTEIAIIGNIRHVNLVKLRGFCAKEGQRLLVYEYMSRGSLDRTLFGSGPVLEWQERVDIALGTARGLAYLHSGCEHKIIHCDVKPENILLHDQFQVKLSDFGLSKLLGTEQSTLFTTMRGTRGYLAPEWLTISSVSDKTDVYSFGMVLLELVSGRKNCAVRTRSCSTNDEASSGGYSPTSSVSALVYFPLFALDMHEQGRYLDLIDQRLLGRVTGEEVEKLVCVALCCVHEEPTLRPSMATVVGMLEGGIPLSRPRVESLNFLRFYGRQYTEASTIEEGNELTNGVELSPQANVSSTTNSAALLYRSYISSQDVSGPR